MNARTTGMINAREKLLGDLLDANQQVQDKLDDQDLGFTIDQAVAVKGAIQDTTLLTLQAIESQAQIFPHQPPGVKLGNQPFFDDDELSEAYITAINS
jgi:hypothetical protein